MIADACESFLVDSDLMTKSVQLYEKDKTLWQKIKDVLSRMLNRIKKAYKHLSPESREGKETLRLSRDKLQQAYGLWKQGVTAAAENMRNAKIGNPTNDGGVINSVRITEDGKQYVVADRKVIHGTDSTKWGSQVTNYINDKIRNGEDVVVYAQDGDALTITRDTAGKAQFKNRIKIGDNQYRDMTDEEYALKLRAETHIDEVAKVSKRGKKDVPDTKNHAFAKDGFNYRTAYFMDFDGSYYRLTLSVGKNGTINTVYNVGKIKEAERPLVVQRPTRIISTEGELNSVSNTIIPESSSKINPNGKKSDRLSADLFTDDDYWFSEDADDTDSMRYYLSKNPDAVGVMLDRTKQHKLPVADLRRRIKGTMQDYGFVGKAAQEISSVAEKSLLSDDLTGDKMIADIRSAVVDALDKAKYEDEYAAAQYDEIMGFCNIPHKNSCSFIGYSQKANNLFFYRLLRATI